LSDRKTVLHSVAAYFLRGLLIVVPVSVTLYVLYASFLWIDGLIKMEETVGFRIPGLGALIILVAVTAMGAIASNILTRYLLEWIEGVFRRLPLVRLLYTSIKDLVGAFVGETKRFDRPVLVSLFPGSDLRAVGFITRDGLSGFDLPDHVAVYFPQAFNFAGNLLVMPKERAIPVQADSSATMAFVVSGGVAGGEGSDRETGVPPGARKV